MSGTDLPILAIAQAGNQSGSGDWGLAIFVILLVSAVVVPLAILRSRRGNARAVSEQELRESRDRDAVHREREARAYAQNEAINDMAADKLRAEAQLLELQIQLAKRELNSRERADAFNELVMSKVKLEVESLRLQVIEQRKRLDGFVDGDD